MDFIARLCDDFGINALFVLDKDTENFKGELYKPRNTVQKIIRNPVGELEDSIPIRDLSFFLPPDRVVKFLEKVFEEYRHIPSLIKTLADKGVPFYIIAGPSYDMKRLKRNLERNDINFEHLGRTLKIQCINDVVSFFSSIENLSYSTVLKLSKFEAI